jgi:acylphosphatase
MDFREIKLNCAGMQRRRNALSNAKHLLYTEACLTALAAVASVAQPYVAAHCCSGRSCLSVWMQNGTACPRNERCSPGHRGCRRRRRNPRQFTGIRRRAGRDLPGRDAFASSRICTSPFSCAASQAPCSGGACQRAARRKRRSRSSLARRASMAEIIHRFLVTGKVQGVCYRQSTRLEAKRLGLRGSARNLPDGSVEVWAQGSPAALDALHQWLRRGPAHARVDSVRKTQIADVDNASKPEIPAGFEVF